MSGRGDAQPAASPDDRRAPVDGDGDGAWAAVTGASSGIGEAFARELSARGYAVLLVARDRSTLDAVAATLPGPSEVLSADLSDPAGIARVEARLRARPVDLLVNNAGTGRWGRFTDPAPRGTTHDDRGDPLVDTVTVNAVAAARLARAVLPAMREADHGGIITVSSPAAAGPAPMIAVYAATKSFTDSLDASLRAELATDGAAGVTITTLWPSWTRTRFHDRIGQDVVAVPDGEWTTPAVVARRAVEAHLRGEATVHVPARTWRHHATEARLRARRTLRGARGHLPAPVKRVGRRVRSLLGR